MLLVATDTSSRSRVHVVAVAKLCLSHGHGHPVTPLYCRMFCQKSSLRRRQRSIHPAQEEASAAGRAVAGCYSAAGGLSIHADCPTRPAPAGAAGAAGAGTGRLHPAEGALTLLQTSASIQSLRAADMPASLEEITVVDHLPDFTEALDIDPPHLVAFTGLQQLRQVTLVETTGPGPWTWAEYDGEGECWSPVPLPQSLQVCTVT